MNGIEVYLSHLDLLQLKHWFTKKENDLNCMFSAHISADFVRLHCLDNERSEAGFISKGAEDFSMTSQVLSAGSDCAGRDMDSLTETLV